jgi:Tfp pilus assembly protein PilO
VNLKALEDIPEGLRKGAVIGVIILFIAGLFYFLYLPKIKELRKIRAEIDRVEKEIEEAKRIERDFHPVSQEEEGKWKQVKSRLCALIPPERDVHKLIYELAGRARKCNIFDISFKSGKEINTKIFQGRKEVLSPVPIQVKEIFEEDVDYFFIKISSHSGYRDLAQFLEDIQKIDRFLEMESLVIKRNFPLISAELAVKAYYRQSSEVISEKEEER